MAEGDAELSGTAIEASANVLVGLRAHWITHGFDEDLNRAMNAAARALLDLVVTRHGLSRDDAYSLISVAADCPPEGHPDSRYFPPFLR